MNQILDQHSNHFGDHPELVISLLHSKLSSGKAERCQLKQLNLISQSCSVSKERNDKTVAIGTLLCDIQLC